MKQQLPSFAVIGGDMRIAKTARLLADDGYNVTVFGLDNGIELGSSIKRAGNIDEAVLMSDSVVLPIPLSSDGFSVTAPLSRQPICLHDVFSAASPDQLLLGGMISEKVRALAEQNRLRLVDYYAREELIVRNAIPTAEGAIQIAMAETPFTLQGAAALVTGFGRVARVLAHKLSCLGARVTIASRRLSDKAWCEVYGYRHVSLERLPGEVGSQEILFNTIPAMIFGRELLGLCRRGAVLIDLASKPGGVDHAQAKLLGVKSILALSLPGKVAPETAGRIIRDAVVRAAEEENR